MAKSKIKVLIIKEKSSDYQVKEIENSLDEFRKIIDCDFIDITERSINGKYFDIIVDDEGLLKENPTITAVNSKYQPLLAGTLIFCKVDNSIGEEISLSDEDIELLKNNLLFNITDSQTLMRID